MKFNNHQWNFKQSQFYLNLLYRISPFSKNCLRIQPDMENETPYYDDKQRTIDVNGQSDRGKFSISLRITHTDQQPYIIYPSFSHSIVCKYGGKRRCRCWLTTTQFTHVSGQMHLQHINWGWMKGTFWYKVCVLLCFVSDILYLLGINDILHAYLYIIGLCINWQQFQLQNVARVEKIPNTAYDQKLYQKIKERVKIQFIAKFYMTEIQ